MSFRSRTIFCVPVLLAASALLSVPALSQAAVPALPLPKQATPAPASPKPPSKEVIALFDAANDGNTAKVQALLDKGVSVNSQAPNGVTPLILASMMNHPDTVKLLLNRGADVNAALGPSDYIGGSTALILASSSFGCIMAGAKMPPAPKGYEGHEIEFMQKHRDLFVKWNQQIAEWSKGYGVIIRMLVDHGADVNAQTKTGTTAIVHAAESGELDMVRLLLDRGARLDLPTHEIDLLDGRSIDGTNGYEAVTGATTVGQHNPELIKLLLAHGAQPNAKSTNDMTPLGRASEGGDAEVVQMLLAGGAEVNAYDGFGRTALMLAQGKRHADVVTLLRQAGAKDLPQGAHTEVTLKTLGRDADGDTKMQVTVTPRPNSGSGGSK